MASRYKGSLLGLALVFSASEGHAADDAPQPSPLAAVGIQAGVPTRYTEEERQELNELEARVKEFETRSSEYRAMTRKLIEDKYKAKRGTLFNSYEETIVKLEGDARQRRENAIAKFETFLNSYPDDHHFTPDAMFRLAELYFERSYDIYFQA